MALLYMTVYVQYHVHVYGRHTYCLTTIKTAVMGIAVGIIL